jgi:hypothetical protein
VSKYLQQKDEKSAKQFLRHLNVAMHFIQRWLQQKNLILCK